MGLYITGMEMPKEQNVPTWAVFFSSGEVRIYKDGFNTDHGNGKGTAVPVLPHGRLGDLDELKERATKRLYASNHGSIEEAYYAALIDLIDTATTIIPGEGKSGG